MHQECTTIIVQTSPAKVYHKELFLLMIHKIIWLAGIYRTSTCESEVDLQVTYQYDCETAFTCKVLSQKQKSSTKKQDKGAVGEGLKCYHTVKNSPDCQYFTAQDFVTQLAVPNHTEPEHASCCYCCCLVLCVWVTKIEKKSACVGRGLYNLFMLILIHQLADLEVLVVCLT